MEDEIKALREEIAKLRERVAVLEARPAPDVTTLRIGPASPGHGYPWPPAVNPIPPWAVTCGSA